MTFHPYRGEGQMYSNINDQPEEEIPEKEEESEEDEEEGYQGAVC